MQTAHWHNAINHSAKKNLMCVKRVNCGIYSPKRCPWFIALLISLAYHLIYFRFENKLLREWKTKATLLGTTHRNFSIKSRNWSIIDGSIHDKNEFSDFEWIMTLQFERRCTIEYNIFIIDKKPCEKLLNFAAKIRLFRQFKRKKIQSNETWHSMSQHNYNWLK